MLKSQNKRELEVQLCWNRLKKPNGGSRKGISPRKKNKKKKKSITTVPQAFPRSERMLALWLGKRKDEISELPWVWKKAAKPSVGNKGT